MENNAKGLYAELFKTINQLNDKENPMPLDRAKVISGVAQTVINLAKTEVDLYKINRRNKVLFLSDQPEDSDPDDPEESEQDDPKNTGKLPYPFGQQTAETPAKSPSGITIHRLK